MKIRPRFVLHRWLVNWVVLLSMAILIVTLAITLILEGQPEANRSPGSQTAPRVNTCVPPPRPSEESGPPTPTPQPSEFGKLPLIAPPTITPMPIAKINDLAPDLPDQEKAYVYVWRCTGKLELFRINPASAKGSLEATVPLQPGDIILISAPPASLMGHQPSRGTAAAPLYLPTQESSAPLPSTAPFISSVVPPTPLPSKAPLISSIVPPTPLTSTPTPLPYPGAQP